MMLDSNALDALYLTRNKSVNYSVEKIEITRSLLSILRNEAMEKVDSNNLAARQDVETLTNALSYLAEYQQIITPSLFQQIGEKQVEKIIEGLWPGDLTSD